MEYRRTAPRLPGTGTAEVFWDGEILPAVLNDVSSGGASLLLDRTKATGDFLVILEPGREPPVALYMLCLATHRAGDRWLVRAQFGHLEEDEADYLVHFLEHLNGDIARAHFARRFAGQKPARTAISR